MYVCMYVSMYGWLVSIFIPGLVFIFSGSLIGRIEQVRDIFFGKYLVISICPSTFSVQRNQRIEPVFSSTAKVAK